MNRSVQTGPRYHGLLFALVLAGALVGSGGCGPFANTCDTDADCKENARCVASYCTTQCVRDSDCRSKTDECREGRCQPVSDPSCSTDDECVQPGPCQLDTGVLCVAGACVYQPRRAGIPCNDGNLCTTMDLCDGMGACVGAVKPCTNQPASECIGDNDDILVTYSTPGICDPDSGECTYTRMENECPRCSTDCLTMCLGKSCPDTAGGCQIAGRCVPTWPEGRCEYDFAPTGTHCSLPEHPGALLGFCSQGDCVECLADADCDAPPGHDACFTATCVQGACAYTPAPDRVCEVEHCTGGVVYFERRCDAAGQCPPPDPELVSCGGYACNAAGNGCRTTCVSTSECVAGLSCRIDNTCEPPRDNGESCTEHGQCASGRCQCVDARCEERKCAPSLCPCRYDLEPDGVCDGFIEDGRDDAGDSCGALSCNGQGGCNLANGAFCTNAAHCESNICADGVCCNETCDGPCVACNLFETLGACTGRAAGDGSECNPCQGCSGPAAACVPQPNGPEGNQCTGPCTACEGGACVLRATGDATECGTCNECRGGSCSPITGATGKNCADADGYCCNGTCVNPPGPGTEYATPCGSGDCTGTWVCANTAARCSSYGAGCDACNGDAILDGSCTGDAFGTSCVLLATQTECPACSTCADNGATASCAGAYTRNTEDTVGNLVCAGPAVACDGSGACKKDYGQACGSPGECASGFCVDGVCCESACNGPCMACGGDGSCNVTPADDVQCGSIDCDGLDRPCRDYADITTGRCEGFGDCKDPNTAADCTVYTNASSGSEGYGAGCPACQDCNGAGDCAPVASGQQDVGCDGGTTTCSNADACNGAGQCQFNHLPSGNEGNGGGCPTCQDCNGAGACAYVANGQQDLGCTTGATTCSDADTCNGAGQCLANHLPNGSDGGCPTCQDCNGAGACVNVGSGQQDAGCNAGATACSNADTCNGAGQCLPNHLPNGSDGGCPVCQNCNGSGACANVPSGQQDTGCSGGVTTCSNADACNGAGQCQFNHLPSGNEGNGGGCPTCQDCNGSGACAAVNGAIDVGCDDVLECRYQICQTGTCLYRNELDGTPCGDPFLTNPAAPPPPCPGTCRGGVCEPDPYCYPYSP